MFYIKKDNHKFYDFVESVFKNSVYSIGIIKTKDKTHHFKKMFSKLRFIFLIWDVFYIPYSAYRKSNNDFIFLREFISPLLCISAILMFPIRKKLLLNVNHNFQRYEHRLIHRLSIKFIDILGYSFFMFEYENTPFHLRNKIISIPFLLEDIKLPSGKKTIPTIGIVGAYREEKGMEELLRTLLKIHKKVGGFDMVFACDKQAILDVYQNDNITLINTLSFERYNDAINTVDILVFNYSELDYKIRHSGVITDSIFKGKIVIAPNYPVFQSQLSIPKRVGFNFDCLEGLDETVFDAIEFYKRKNLQKNFVQYFEYRSIEAVSAKLNKVLSTK